jgi:hypothetical protein
MLEAELQGQEAHGPGEITQIDVDRLLHKVNAFYNGERAHGATNKWYLDPKTNEQKDYNQVSDLFNERLVNSLRPEIQGKTPYEQGKHLYEKRLDYGNCGEMSSLTGYLAACDEQLAGKIKHMCIANATENITHFDQIPANHALLLISDGYVPPRASTIAGTFADSRGLWAVDAWMGIACPAAQYPQKAKEALDQLANDGKVIVHHKDKIRDDRTNRKDLPVPDGHYSNEHFLDAVINTHLSMRPIEIPQLQQAHQTQTQPQTRPVTEGTSARTERSRSPDSERQVRLGPDGQPIRSPSPVATARSSSPPPKGVVTKRTR